MQESCSPSQQQAGGADDKAPKLVAPFLLTAIPLPASLLSDFLGLQSQVYERFSGEQEARPEQCCVQGTAVHWHAGLHAPNPDFLQRCLCIPVKSILIPGMGNKAHGKE